MRHHTHLNKQEIYRYFKERCKQGSKQVNIDIRDRKMTVIEMERVEKCCTHFFRCQTDVTKHASVHEYELAAFTTITVSVTLIQTA